MTATPSFNALHKKSFVPLLSYQDPVLVGGGGVSGPPAQRGLTPQGPRSGPMLDIPTPQCGQLCDNENQSGKRVFLNSSSRRIFSRALMGVKKPGRYYFITLTSSPQSPSVKKSWDALRKWIKRYRPHSVHFHVFTSEGYGVIHMIIRLGTKEKRIEVRELRHEWVRLHRAVQIKILRVDKHRDLARYISDQRHKKSLAGEFCWQNLIQGWGYTKGWLPKGFGKAFGRFWWRSRDAENGDREMFLHDWLMRCYQDECEISSPPTVKMGVS